MQIALLGLLNDHQAAGHGPGGRELVHGGEAERAALEVTYCLLVSQQPEFVCRLPRPGRVERLRNWDNRPRLYVGLSFGEGVEQILRQIEVGRHEVLRRYVNPVCDRKGTVLGERTIVEGQDKVARLVADGLDRMAVASSEVPKIARFVIVDLARARRLDHHRLASAINDVGPFGCYGMPM